MWQFWILFVHGGHLNLCTTEESDGGGELEWAKSEEGSEMRESVGQIWLRETSCFRVVSGGFLEIRDGGITCFCGDRSCYNLWEFGNQVCHFLACSKAMPFVVRQRRLNEISESRRKKITEDGWRVNESNYELEKPMVRNRSDLRDGPGRK